MPLRSLQFLRVLACLAVAWQPSSALAQDEDTQLWVTAVASGAIDDATHLTFDASARWSEDSGGDEQQTARITIMHEVADWLRLGGGGGMFEPKDGGTELRPHQEIAMRSGRLSARTRIEQRFFDDADRVELRVRQMIRYSQPLGDSWNISLDGEYLGLAQTRERDSERPRDEWRAHMIVNHEVSETLTLGGSYLLIHTPREGQPDRLSHVPQANITVRF